MAGQATSQGHAATDIKKAAWENSDFPILCETCLGDNPFVRMMKLQFSKECKICQRPFTVFRWRPGGKNTRFKKTEICQTCAKVKNVCQTCILDLEYGLPVQVRDAGLGDEAVEVPHSNVLREYMAQQADQRLAAGDLPYGHVAPNDAIMRLARTQPFYRRNRPHVCSFWLKGECNRGNMCPYRHEEPEHGKDDPLAKQNISDRYYGVNDPVAAKMMSLGEQPTPAPPEDTSITTLYVGGIQSNFNEQDIRDKFEEYGEISTIRVIPHKFCSFVTFSSRPSAERAVDETFNKLFIKGTRARVAWGRPAPLAATQIRTDAMAPGASLYGPHDHVKAPTVSTDERMKSAAYNVQGAPPVPAPAPAPLPADDPFVKPAPFTGLPAAPGGGPIVPPPPPPRPMAGPSGAMPGPAAAPGPSAAAAPAPGPAPGPPRRGPGPMPSGPPGPMPYAAPPAMLPGQGYRYPSQDPQRLGAIAPSEKRTDEGGLAPAAPFRK